MESKIDEILENQKYMIKLLEEIFENVDARKKHMIVTNRNMKKQVLALKEMIGQYPGMSENPFLQAMMGNFTDLDLEKVEEV